MKIKKLEKQVTSLKDSKKDIKDKMHYYKKNCEKMNADLKLAYETWGQLKATVASLEKEKEIG